MNPSLLISIAAFVGVAALVGCVAMFLREKSDKGDRAAPRRFDRTEHGQPP